jgi:hypothetical protein
MSQDFNLALFPIPGYPEILIPELYFYEFVESTNVSLASSYFYL